MQERYVLMMQHRGHLTVLFELCGTPAEQGPGEPAPAPLTQNAPAGAASWAAWLEGDWPWNYTAEGGAK